MIPNDVSSVEYSYKVFTLFFTFALMKTEAFSRNVSKVFQSQSWYQRTLFSINIPRTCTKKLKKSRRNLHVIRLKTCINYNCITDLAPFFTYPPYCIVINVIQNHDCWLSIFGKCDKAHFEFFPCGLGLGGRQEDTMASSATIMKMVSSWRGCYCVANVLVIRSHKL